MSEPARGIRNNNPINLERTSIKWQGLDPNQEKLDPRFCVFLSAQWGIRAGARNFLSYQKEHGLRTVRELISRHAPSNENNTEKYAEFVAKQVGVDADTPIVLDDAAVMLPFMKAVITEENGRQPYSDAVLMQAITMAGVHNARGPGPAKKIMALCTAGCGVVGSALTPDNLHQAQGFLQPVVEVSPVLKTAFVAVTLGILGLTMFGLSKSHRETGA